MSQWPACWPGCFKKQRTDGHTTLQTVGWLTLPHGAKVTAHEWGWPPSNSEGYPYTSLHSHTHVLMPACAVPVSLLSPSLHLSSKLEFPSHTHTYTFTYSEFPRKYWARPISHFYKYHQLERFFKCNQASSVHTTFSTLPALTLKSQRMEWITYQPATRRGWLSPQIITLINQLSAEMQQNC